MQVNDGAQTITCYEKSILHDYQSYSYSYHKPSILGRNKIIYHLEGYSYTCTVTSDNELIKIKSEYILIFSIIVISSEWFKEHLGKYYKSHTLYHNSTKHCGHTTFHHIHVKYRDVILLIVYKKDLSYAPSIQSNDTYQIYTIS